MTANLTTLLLKVGQNWYTCKILKTYRLLYIYDIQAIDFWRWFQFYSKYNDKDTKFWTECVSREFVFPAGNVSIHSYYHWSLTRSVSFHLRSCWFIVDSAGDFPWIQNSNNTFSVFWTQFVWTNKHTSGSRREKKNHKAQIHCRPSQSNIHLIHPH